MASQRRYAAASSWTTSGDERRTFVRRARHYPEVRSEAYCVMFRIFPRGGKAMARYGRRKVAAILVTFTVVWGYLNCVAPDRRDALRGVGTRTPGAAFRERLSGEPVQALAVVEELMVDSLSVSGETFPRARLRTTAGHPFTLLLASTRAALPSPGDTVRVRGRYDWGLKGGTVTVTKDGWLHAPG